MMPWRSMDSNRCCVVVPLVFRYKKLVENLTTHQAVSYSPSLATIRFVLGSRVYKCGLPESWF